MFDDTTQTQPTTDATSMVEPSDGGVLGNSAVTTPVSTPIVEPTVGSTAASTTDPTVVEPTTPYNTSPVEETVSTNSIPTTISPASSSASSNDLLQLKQQALASLSPLLGTLDQTPEEKFRTTMMMIQASDDQTLVKAAYEAANQISDEKTKAQALLDVVNEINYFTQKPKDEAATN